MAVTSDASSLLLGRTISGPATARVKLDGRDYINFFGSAYLALSQVPEIRAAVRRALEENVPFSEQLPSASGVVDPLFTDLESAAAVACGTEASVYFASGYLIGMVGLAALADSFDMIALDERAHVSLKDAARLCRRPSFTFEHCSPGALAELLRRELGPRQRPLVVTDGAFPTSGRVPPLAEYAPTVGLFDGRFFIDESHSFGVVGRHGRGSAEYCGVESLATCGATLSKALCAQGAIVGCTSAAAARLQSLPPIRSACAGSPLSAAAGIASLQYVTEHPELRAQLGVIVEYFRARMRDLGLEVIDSPAPIVSFQWGRREDMLALQRKLLERGIHIHYSTYSDAGREGVIRCAVFRDHSREDIDALVGELACA